MKASSQNQKLTIQSMTQMGITCNSVMYCLTALFKFKFKFKEVIRSRNSKDRQYIVKAKKAKYTTGVTGWTGTAYLSEASEFTLSFQQGSCFSMFSFMCMFCRSLVLLLYFFFWPLCCLSFDYLRILITSLVSSNIFYKALHIKRKRGNTNPTKIRS